MLCQRWAQRHSRHSASCIIGHTRSDRILSFFEALRVEETSCLCSASSMKEDHLDLRSYLRPWVDTASRKCLTISSFLALTNICIIQSPSSVEIPRRWQFGESLRVHVTVVTSPCLISTTMCCIQHIIANIISTLLCSYSEFPLPPLPISRSLLTDSKQQQIFEDVVDQAGYIFLRSSWLVLTQFATDVLLREMLLNVCAKWMLQPSTKWTYHDLAKWLSHYLIFLFFFFSFSFEYCFSFSFLFLYDNGCARASWLIGKHRIKGQG